MGEVELILQSIYNTHIGEECIVGTLVYHVIFLSRENKWTIKWNCESDPLLYFHLMVDYRVDSLADQTLPLATCITANWINCKFKYHIQHAEISKWKTVWHNIKWFYRSKWIWFDQTGRFQKATITQKTQQRPALFLTKDSHITRGISYRR